MNEESPSVPTDVDLQTKQALLAKTEADARAAEAAARKAEVEAANLESPAAQQARDATNLLTVADAEQKAAAARQQQLTAMIPDLSKVKDSTLEVSKEGPAIGGSLLTFGALTDAAKAIVARIDPPHAGWHVLVTSDPDLATPDSLYHEVELGLAQLVTAADELLSQTSDDGGEGVRTASAELAVAAVAAAVPSVLSLLSAERSVTTTLVTVTDLAAAAEVAGALEAAHREGISVVHDEFRLVVPGRIYELNTAVATKRHTLVARKITLADRKSVIDADLMIAKAEEKDAEKAAADGDPNGASTANLETNLDNARKRVAALTRQSAELATRLGLIESLLSSLDAFVAAIRVVPVGGRRSPLATAALVEQLHAGANDQFTHVLLVKAQPGQSSQLTDDRPLWSKDKFSTFVEVNVTYLLIGTNDSRIIRGGTVTATAAAHGDIGSDIRFSTTTRVAGA